MNEKRTNRRLVAAALPLLLFAVAAGAQDAAGLLRTQFGSADGIGTVVDRIARTPDGFLWLITNKINLHRFDGRSFHLFPEPRPHDLAVAPNGDVWVATADGLTRIPAAQGTRFTLTGLTSYPGPGKGIDILRLRFSRGGVLWVGTSDGLFRFEGGRFVPVGPRVSTNEIHEAADGHLLVKNARGFLELDGGREVPHPPVAARLGVRDKDLFNVVKGRDGTLWYCTAHGVARERDGRIEKLGAFGPSGHAAYLAHEDARGTVWIGREEGLFRATSAGLEPVAPGMNVRTLFSDPDGNLWAGTNGDGLHRFREPAVRMFTTGDGLPSDVIATVLAARDGTVWTGANCGGISRFDGARFRTLDEKDGLRNTCVWALAEDADGGIWAGTWGGGAFRYHGGRFTRYSTEQGLADDRVTSIVAARDGAVWIGTRGGLTRLRGGRLRNFTTADGLAADLVMRVFEDRQGGIWVAARKGLDRLAGDRFAHVAALPGTLLIPFGDDGRGGFFVEDEARSMTLSLNGGRASPIADMPVALDMVLTPTGESWFVGEGVRRVAAGGLLRPRQPDEPLDREEFSAADGLTATEVSMSGGSLARTADGSVWVATPKGVAMFDPRRLPVTGAKPSVYLTAVTIGRNRQAAASRDVVLPPGTTHAEIEFAAVELTSPEKIRMQYRLDGVDPEWLDAPRDARAIYSHIPVGTHALRIRACNRNGVWDRQGVAFTVTQLPYFYQTRWFAAAMAALAVLLIAAIYRLRVRQLSRRMSALFDERLAERTRVAREIHDTFLQTVQGSRLVADHALKNPDDHARAIRALQQLSVWLAQATEEGRAALNSLRAAATEKNGLAEALRRAIDECRTAAGDAEVSLSVRGAPREIHPVVRDEIYRIAYEAIRNACTHSGGTRVDVALDYGPDLGLRVSDDGTGIDPGIVEKGRESHFGLRGMRERAERIDGAFQLVSAPGAGTVVTLVVPGRIAFRA